MLTGITLLPSLSIAIQKKINNEKGKIPFPFKTKNVIYTGFARAALLEGLKLLKIGKGDSILIPNYVCQVVLAPLNKLGIAVKFYDIDKNLRPKWKELSAAIDRRTKALLLVHYFGFPNDIEQTRSFCIEHNLFFIEDNAHGFLSYYQGKPLGNFGDISIFSFHKTKWADNGAALVVNQNNCNVKDIDLKGYRDFKFQLKSFIPQRSGRSRHSIEAKVDALCVNNEVCQEFDLTPFMERISSVAYQQLRNFDYSDMIIQRRKVYLDWLDFFKSLELGQIVFPELPNGVVPYVFPICVENRREFMIQMALAGIDCFPWPYLPQDSKEKYFSKHLVCLPVFPSFDPQERLKRSNFCKKNKNSFNLYES